MPPLNLLHVAVHSGINQNAGDILLCHATRRCFEYFLGDIRWTLHQAWKPFDAALANDHDGVVVGGGGMLLPDQEGASYEASGWQWNCTLGQLEAIRVPLIIFGIGHNRFRGQPGFSPLFSEHIYATIDKADFFSMREKGGIHALEDDLEAVLSDMVSYQPCPTTCLWQLYPDSRPRSRPQVLGINVATDRACYRYPEPHLEDRTFQAITAVAQDFARQGWTIAVLGHKPQDAVIAPYLAARGLCFRLIPLFDKSPDDILRTYREMGLVIGMRGHAQLIPFGLRIPILSVISHDKLQRFLEDIERCSWGIDVSDPDFKATLRKTALRLKDSPPDVAYPQQQSWEITRQNMYRIAAMLGVLGNVSV